MTYQANRRKLAEDRKAILKSLQAAPSKVEISAEAVTDVAKAVAAHSAFTKAAIGNVARQQAEQANLKALKSSTANMPQGLRDLINRS